MGLADNEYKGMHAGKSAKRERFIENVVEKITADSIYKGLTPKMKEEGFVHRIEPYLRQGIQCAYRDENPGRSESWYEEIIEKSLLEEKLTTTTVKQTIFFGMNHRPDMIIKHWASSREMDYRIALEFKIVSDGSDVRAVLGQALAYSSDYEFTICLLYDVTNNACVKTAVDAGGNREEVLLDKMWTDFNARVLVVAPIGK